MGKNRILSKYPNEGTIQGNTFNGVSQLVQTDGAGKLPAIDGSQLTGIGGGDLLSTNNLNDVASASTSRTNLGLAIGTDVQAHDATIVVDADIGISVQGYDATLLNDADIGVNVQAYDATIVVDADIGTTVQAYDADTAKTDVAQTFTTPQRTSTTAEDNAISFNGNNNFTLTATAANITVTNQTIGQAGTIIITTAENITGWGTEFDWGNTGVPASLTGIETFAYYISGASGANSIKIGRL